MFGALVLMIESHKARRRNYIITAVDTTLLLFQFWTVLGGTSDNIWMTAFSCFAILFVAVFSGWNIAHVVAYHRVKNQRLLVRALLELPLRS